MTREPTFSSPCPCPTEREEHYGVMPVVHGGLTAGYWVTDFLALSGGVVLRNQPRPSFRGPTHAPSAGPWVHVDFGDLAGIPWLAAEVEIEHAIGIVAQVQLPILGEHVFGPTLALGVRGVLWSGPRVGTGDEADIDVLVGES